MIFCYLAFYGPIIYTTFCSFWNPSCKLSHQLKNFVTSGNHAVLKKIIERYYSLRSKYLVKLPKIRKFNFIKMRAWIIAVNPKNIVNENIRRSLKRMCRNECAETTSRKTTSRKTTSRKKRTLQQSNKRRSKRPRSHRIIRKTMEMEFRRNFGCNAIYLRQDSIVKFQFSSNNNETKRTLAVKDFTKHATCSLLIVSLESETLGFHKSNASNYETVIITESKLALYEKKITLR